MIRLSDIDEKRFGIRSARADGVTSGNMEAIEEFCRQHRVRFLIARCNAENIMAAQQLEGKGFGLMDTLVYYAFDSGKKAASPPPRHADYVIREIQAGEEGLVQDMAAHIFRHYPGHYHADPHLDRSACDAIYPDWAYQSCRSREVADTVLVAQCGNTLAGFLTLKEKGEILLNGVLPAFQRKGIYTHLVSHALQRMRPQSEKMFISTQLPNLAPQKAWVKLGFEPHHAVYTFHKWY